MTLSCCRIGAVYSNTTKCHYGERFSLGTQFLLKLCQPHRMHSPRSLQRMLYLKVDRAIICSPVTQHCISKLWAFRQPCLRSSLQPVLHILELSLNELPQRKQLFQRWCAQADHLCEWECCYPIFLAGSSYRKSLLPVTKLCMVLCDIISISNGDGCTPPTASQRYEPCLPWIEHQRSLQSQRSSQNRWFLRVTLAPVGISLGWSSLSPSSLGASISMNPYHLRYKKRTSKNLPLKLWWTVESDPPLSRLSGRIVSRLWSTVVCGKVSLWTTVSCTFTW